MSEKTEQPTEKRLRESRARGQLIKSQEVIVGVQLAVTLVFFMSQGDSLSVGFTNLINITLEVLNKDLQDAITKITKAVLGFFSQFLGTLGGILIVCTILSSLMQTGFVLAVEAVGFSLNKLNFINNIAQIFSVKSIFELLKSVIKVTLISSCFFYIIKHYFSSFQYLPVCGVICILPVISQLILWLWGILVAAYVVFGIADYAFQRFSMMKQLMMTKEEVKQEYKNMEGSPEIKSRRRQLHQEMQSGSIDANVKKSSVVVRNPSHFAVCIYYEAGKVPLPKLLEKGKDEKALLICKLAEKYNIPVVRDVELARGIYFSSKPGSYIESDFFEAVAAILRKVLDIEYVD